MTFRFIAQNAEEWPLAWMCDALEVSESGHHAWAGYDRVRLHSSLGFVSPAENERVYHQKHR